LTENRTRRISKKLWESLKRIARKSRELRENLERIA